MPTRETHKISIMSSLMIAEIFSETTFLIFGLVLIYTLLKNILEWLHTTAHRRQEESDGDRDYTAGIRRRHQCHHQAGHQPASSSSPGGQRGHGHPAAGSGRHHQPVQQGNPGK